MYQEELIAVEVIPGERTRIPLGRLGQVCLQQHQLLIVVRLDNLLWVQLEIERGYRLQDLLHYIHPLWLPKQQLYRIP